jgi:hypothetical protein
MTGKNTIPTLYMVSPLVGGYRWGEINTIMNEGTNIPTGMFSLGPEMNDWIYFTIIV